LHLAPAALTSPPYTLTHLTPHSFGGMTSLYVAKQLVEADETGKAVVLVVCAEACTVHICADPKVQLAVGNSLFGDGAGAAIVTHAGFRGSTPPPPPAAGAAAGSAAPPIFSLESDHHEWSMGPFASEIVPNSAGHMTWKQSKQGGRYDMWLAKEIPEALLGFFTANSLSLLPRVGILNPYSCAWAIHPGGKGILRSLETALGALGIKPTGIDASHSVLENYGNMSSATIFFVLQRVLSATTKDCAFVAAFGPGLTVEFGSFHRVKAERG
jgi:predicted naringenin-chalcone synthase